MCGAARQTTCVAGARHRVEVERSVSARRGWPNGAAHRGAQAVERSEKPGAAGLTAQPTAARNPSRGEKTSSMPGVAGLSVQPTAASNPWRGAKKPDAAGLTAQPIAANWNAARNRTSLAFRGRTGGTARHGKREGPSRLATRHSPRRHALPLGGGFGAVAGPNRRALVPAPIYFGPRRTNAPLSPWLANSIARLADLPAASPGQASAPNSGPPKSESKPTHPSQNPNPNSNSGPMYLGQSASAVRD